MTLPLQGIKVIDMSQVYFGPGGAVYLADQGAEVIKIETIRGDAMRHRYTSPYLTKWNMSKPFLSLNRNKKSISLDIRTEEGKKIVSDLCKTTDVFILNMRPGTEKQFGLDFETLSKINDKLIKQKVELMEKHYPAQYKVLAQLNLKKSGDPKLIA